jgi:hypothetical protein
MSLKKEEIDADGGEDKTDTEPAFARWSRH